MRQVIEVTVAGNHHCLFVGPPGSGKTLSAKAVGAFTPPLTIGEAIEVTRILSIAGMLREQGELIARPPFRAPHHSISYAGMLGGGNPIAPGEIALAHNGILLLDEALEFRRDVLQGLRQPLEEGEIRISRSQRVARFPSDFLLIMTANICPCGNFGKRNSSCFCKLTDIKKYWRRLGGAFLDRIPLRSALTSRLVGTDQRSTTYLSAEAMIARIHGAIEIQRARYRTTAIRRNGHLRAEAIAKYCPLSDRQTRMLRDHALSHQLSHRAAHTSRAVARTIADLDRVDQIADHHLQQALGLRTIAADLEAEYSSDVLESLLN